MMPFAEVGKEIQKRKISEIAFKEEIYARFEVDQKLISHYEENIESILETGDKIQISENNILIDGYHRLKATERTYGKDYEIECLVHLTDNLDYIELESYSANQKHGKANSPEETRRNILRLYAKGHDKKVIQRKLAVSKNTVYRALDVTLEQEKAEREQKVLDLYLRCWTQEQIAEELSISQKTISDILSNFSQVGKSTKSNDFKPFLYNIWNIQKQDNVVSHFGSFPQVFMENLLYYHTEIFDIVYDPFAGGGTTIDACLEWLRRYYCSDRIVTPGREKDIRQWDIANGLPDDLPKPNLAFLDPPYWKQAENKYSDNKQDLANMTLDAFYNTLEGFIKELIKRKIKRVAIVIAPTQYSNIDHLFEDHIFKFDKMFNNKYKIEIRYVIPYSTQQYNGTHVTVMKTERKCMNLIRDLVIWRLI